MYNQQQFFGAGSGAAQGFHGGAYYGNPQQQQGQQPLQQGGVPLHHPAALPRMDENLMKVQQWIAQLLIPEQREIAITELTKVREALPDLDRCCVHSTGAIGRCCCRK